MLRPQESQNHPAAPSAPCDTAGESPDNGILDFAPRVFLRVVAFICVCVGHCLFVCLLFVCLDKSPLEADGDPSSLGVKWLPRNLVSAGSSSVPRPAARPRCQLGFCGPGSRNVFQWHQESKERSRRVAGFYQPVKLSQGETKCLSQRYPE